MDSCCCTIPRLFNHLRKFGLLMHVGNGSVLSKTETEAMYFPSPVHELNTRLRIPRVSMSSMSTGLPVAGFIDFTQEFKYLGSIIHSSLTSEADVDRH